MLHAYSQGSEIISEEEEARVKEPEVVDDYMETFGHRTADI